MLVYYTNVNVLFIDMLLLLIVKQMPVFVGLEIVLLRLYKIVLSPEVEPLSVLELGDHLLFLLLELPAAHQDLQTRHSLAEKCPAQGLKRSDFKFMKILALFSVFDVLKPSFEADKLLLQEVPLSYCIKFGLYDISHGDLFNDFALQIHIMPLPNLLIYTSSHFTLSSMTAKDTKHFLHDGTSKV